MKTIFILAWNQSEDGAKTWKVGEYTNLEDAKVAFNNQLAEHESECYDSSIEPGYFSNYDARNLYSLEIAKWVFDDDWNGRYESIVESEYYYIEKL